MLNQTPVPAGQTAIKGATVAAPSAGATIVNLNAGAVQAPQVYGPAGIYRIAGLIALTGTAETALANVRLQWNNTSQTACPSFLGRAKSLRKLARRKAMSDA